MTISYPLAFPTATDIRSIKVYANDVVGATASSFTAQQQVYDWQAGFWRADIELPPMIRAQAEPWIAWFLALKGRFGTFTMGDPSGRTPRGAGTGTPLVNGAGQTGYTLALDGATAGVTGWLKAGDYLQIGDYMYRNLADANTNGSGQVTLDIWPRHRAATTDNAVVTLLNTKTLWRLVTNERSWSIEPGMFYYGLGFGAVEAI